MSDTTTPDTPAPLSTQVREKPPKVDVPSIGLGTLRPSGTYIILLLQLEEEHYRTQILVGAARALGISLAEFTEVYTDKACPRCGVSLLSHKTDAGRCP